MSPLFPPESIYRSSRSSERRSVAAVSTEPFALMLRGEGRSEPSESLVKEPRGSIATQDATFYWHWTSILLMQLVFRVGLTPSMLQ